MMAQPFIEAQPDTQNESVSTNDTSKREVNSTIRHDPFYNCSMIVFLVEECLFTVPRRCFERDSQVFSGMFSLPAAGDPFVAEDGSSYEKPLRLDGIKEEDFRSFLRVLYPPSSYGQKEKLEQEEWVSVLKLADMWQFKKIRNLAINELTLFPMDIIKKIDLAHRYDIKKWLLPTYTALANRIEDPTFEEGQLLGWSFVHNIMRVRVRVATTTTHTPFCWSCGKQTSCSGKGHGGPATLDHTTSAIHVIFGEGITAAAPFTLQEPFKSSHSSMFIQAP